MKIKTTLSNLSVKFLLVFLSITLVVGLVPISAHANETQGQSEQTEQKEEPEALDTSDDSLITKYAGTADQSTTQNADKTLGQANAGGISITTENCTVSPGTAISYEEGTTVNFVCDTNSLTKLKVTYTDTSSVEQTVVLNAAANEGFTFMGWIINDGSSDTRISETYNASSVSSSTNTIVIKAQALTSTTGKFVNAYDNMITNLAQIAGIAPKDFEDIASEWLNSEKSSVVSGAKKWDEATLAECIQYLHAEAQAGESNRGILALFIYFNYIQQRMLEPSNKYVNSASSNEKPIEITKCLLNSDVTFKGFARLIEALQTGDDIIMISTIISLHPKFLDEFNRCLGEQCRVDSSPAVEVNNSDEDYLFVKHLRENMKDGSELDMSLNKQLATMTGEDIDYYNKELDVINSLQLHSYSEFLTYLQTYAMSLATVEELTEDQIKMLDVLSLLSASMMYTENCIANVNKVEILKGTLNSDIFFKSVAKMIEAAQTRQPMTIVYTIMQVLPKINEEFEKYAEPYSAEIVYSNWVDAAQERIIYQEPVAAIGGREYSSLYGAFSGASNGEEIVLLKNITEVETLSLSGKNISFNLNGFTVTGKENANIIEVSDGATLSLYDSSSDASGVMNSVGTGLCVYATSADSIVAYGGTYNQDFKDSLGKDVMKFDNGDTTFTYLLVTSNPSDACDRIIYNGRFQVCLIKGSHCTLSSDDPNVVIDANGNATMKDVSRSNAGSVTATLDAGYWWSDKTNADKTFSINVEPVEVTLESESAEKVYDGAPLVNTKVHIIDGGLVKGEKLTCLVTGSQTIAGESENTFVVTDSETAKLSNYDVTTQFGTLKVTPSTSVTPTGDGTNGENIDAVTGTKTSDNLATTIIGLTALVVICSAVIIRSRRKRNIK